MKYGLPDNNLQSIKSILANYKNLHSAILYGSRAKGNFKASSDIDLTLVGNELTYKNLVNILLELDDLLLPYEFDLSIHKDIDNEGLLSHISRVGEVIYQKK